MNTTHLTIFEKMNTPEVKQAFLSRKENSYNIDEDEFIVFTANQKVIQK